MRKGQICFTVAQENMVTNARNEEDKYEEENFNPLSQYDLDFLGLTENERSTLNWMTPEDTERIIA